MTAGKRSEKGLKIYTNSMQGKQERNILQGKKNWKWILTFTGKRKLKREWKAGSGEKDCKIRRVKVKELDKGGKIIGQ